MNFQQGFALLTFLGFISSTSGQTEGALITEQENPGQTEGALTTPQNQSTANCVTALQNVLAQLCRVKDLTVTERSSNGNIDSNPSSRLYFEEPQLQEGKYGWPWRLDRNKRQKPDVSECCDKPCTRKQLMAFC